MLLGTAVGVLPGIGPAMTVALLLPVTYALRPSSAFIMFAGIYYGGMYGGSTTSILLNTPGESSSVVTAIEGNKMAKAGRAAQALATAAIGSFVAGTIGTVLLVLLAPIVVKFAVSLGAPSYFAIMVLALFAVTAVLGTLPAARLLRPVPRPGHRPGRHRPDHRPAAAHLRPAAARRRHRHRRRRGRASSRSARPSGSRPTCAAPLAHVIPVGQPWMGREDWRRSWKPWLRGTALRLPVRRAARRRRRDPDVPVLRHREASSPSTPRSSARAPSRASPARRPPTTPRPPGTLVPLLALGLPTTATAAVMLRGVQQYGIQPGPQLFDHEPELVWGLIASLFVGNTLLLVLNLPLAPVWAKLLQIPRPYLYAGILFFASLGAYSVNFQAFDLGMLLVLGLLGLHDAALRAARAAADHRRDPRPAAGGAAAHSRCSSATGSSRACGPSRWRWSST